MKPKIFFWINAYLLPFCLAYSLQKKYDADYYAIIDITNKPKKFFQTQDLVQFSKTWYYHDYINAKTKPDIQYLESFEKNTNYQKRIMLIIYYKNLQVLIINLFY